MNTQKINLLQRKNKKRITFIYHADYVTGIDTNYSITFGFLERYFKGNYIVIKHSLYKNGETRVYPSGFNGDYRKFPIVGSFPVPLKYALETVFSIVAIIYYKSEIVYALNPMSALAGVLLKKLGLINKVFFINPDFTKKRFENVFLNKGYFFIDKYCTKYCTKNICNSVFVINYKKELYRSINLEDKFFHLPNIPNPWQISQFAEVEKNPNRLIYVGAISSQIDFNKIFDIINFVSRKISVSIKLFLVGDGSDRERLQNYCKERNYDNISFLGVLDHVSTLREIAKSEFGIALYNGSLSYDEFRDSCKIREYQALGCIPITTSVVKSNTSEILKYNSGIIINNLEQLANVILNYITNPNEKNKLINNSVTNFRVYANKYEDLFLLFNT